MATELWTNREPEVAKFIDSYKFDQDMSVKRDKFGGGTSLPLNSDGYEDKQRRLRDERHDEWLVQMDKPKEPVYYRVGTPEQGFPGLGDYEKLRQEKNLLRQKEYNEMLKKQRQLEQEKLDARRHAPPPRPAQPPGPQVDYNAAFEQAKAEDRRAYQDYMKAKEERYWAMRGRPVTPPGGLNIGNYDRQVKEQAPAKKLEYKKMLDEQQREHMFLRARQEPEMAVLDRNSQPPQYLANKPPPGPSYGRGRDEAFKTEPQSMDNLPTYEMKPYPGPGQVPSKAAEDRYNSEIVNGRSKSPADLHPRSPEKPANVEWLKRPVRDDERPPGVGTPLAFKTNSYSRQPPPAPEQGYSSQPPPAPEQGYSRQPQPAPPGSNRGPPFSREGQKSFRPKENGVDGLQSRERPRSRRSLDAERKFSPSKRDNATKPVNQISPRRMKNVLYTDSEEVSAKRVEASKERQKEYNDFLKFKAEQRRHEDDMFRQQQQKNKPAEVVKNPFYSSDDYEKFQKELQRKQGEEYREFLSQKKKEVRNRGWNFDQNGVLELHGDDAEKCKQRELRAERQQDYNAYISQKKKELRNPYENYVYPTVAVAEKPIVDYMGTDIERRKRDLREERKQEYENFKKQQKVTNPGRRHEFVDTASGPYGGLFHGLGEHGPRSDDLNRERQREYNERLNQQYAGKDRPSGRPKWAQDSLPNNTDRGRSPMKNQPPADQYEQMLNEKRREEANLRRFEDPEYQDRLSRGRDRGDDGPRYNYH